LALADLREKLDSLLQIQGIMPPEMTDYNNSELETLLAVTLSLFGDLLNTPSFVEIISNRFASLHSAIITKMKPASDDRWIK
jgi:hypothetical protein